MESDRTRLGRQLLQRLEDLERAGVRQIRRTLDTGAPIPTVGIQESAVSVAGDRKKDASSPKPNVPLPNRETVALKPKATAITPQTENRKPKTENLPPKPENPPVSDLQDLRVRVAACTRCAELARTRTQTVFGDGNPTARLVFMGEAPGADEDRQGVPFVGRAGQLLNDIITKGMKLRREDVYILNTIKCRPPNNRNPSLEEAANCREYLEGQLSLIRPEFICCLGTIAAQNLLDSKLSIGKLRGRWHDFRGIRVLCTYHPAYLLRNPSEKKAVWEDIQILMKAMGI